MNCTQHDIICNIKGAGGSQITESISNIFKETVKDSYRTCPTCFRMERLMLPLSSYSKGVFQQGIKEGIYESLTVYVKQVNIQISCNLR